MRWMISPRLLHPICTTKVATPETRGEPKGQTGQKCRHIYQMEGKTRRLPIILIPLKISQQLVRKSALLIQNQLNLKKYYKFLNFLLKTTTEDTDCASRKKKRRG